MAYEHKPGSFSLFKNDRKEKDSHPDYTGSGVDLEGRPIRVAAWLKKGAKGTFMSVSISLADATHKAAPKQTQGIARRPIKDDKNYDDMNDGRFDDLYPGGVPF